MLLNSIHVKESISGSIVPLAMFVTRMNLIMVWTFYVWDKTHSPPSLFTLKISEHATVALLLLTNQKKKKAIFAEEGAYVS